MLRWNRFVLHGEAGDASIADKSNSIIQPTVQNMAKRNSKRKGDHVFNLIDDVHSPEAIFLKDQEAAHTFEVGCGGQGQA